MHSLLFSYDVKINQLSSICLFQDSLDECSSSSPSKLSRSAEDDGNLTPGSSMTTLGLECLQIMQFYSAAQNQVMKMAIDSCSKDIELLMSIRKSARERNLADLSGGREMRTGLINQWMQMQQHIVPHTTALQHTSEDTEVKGQEARDSADVAVLKLMISNLPTVINKVDHHRVMELDEQITKEAEEDRLVLESLKDRRTVLNTIMHQNSRDMMDQMAGVWKKVSDLITFSCFVNL